MFVKSGSFYTISSYKSVQQPKLKGIYVVMPPMEGFSIEEHNKDW